MTKKKKKVPEKKAKKWKDMTLEERHQKHNERRRTGRANGRPKRPWNDCLYVAAYRLALDGLSNTQIAKHLHISFSIFQRFVRNKPALRQALKDARGTMKETSGVTFRDYVYDMLPLHLQRLWKEINECESEKNGLMRMEALFGQHGVDARKHLFMYALTAGHFNPSTACKKVGITKRVVDQWIQEDPDFSDLMEEIHVHKKNFFESKLIELVDDGDPQVTMFVNKTINKDRGYGEKLEVSVNGKISHEHLVRIDQLDLDKKTLRIINKALKDNAPSEVETGKMGQQLLIPDKREKDGKRSSEES